jgi:hypothetical protein
LETVLSDLNYECSIGFLLFDLDIDVVVLRGDAKGSEVGILRYKEKMDHYAPCSWDDMKMSRAEATRVSEVFEFIRKLMQEKRNIQESLDKRKERAPSVGNCLFEVYSLSMLLLQEKGGHSIVVSFQTPKIGKGGILSDDDLVVGKECNDLLATKVSSSS